MLSNLFFVLVMTISCFALAVKVDLKDKNIWAVWAYRILIQGGATITLVISFLAILMLFGLY